MTEFLRHLDRALPPYEKILAAVGGTFSGTSAILAATLSDWQAIVGIAVGVVTFAMLLPRAIGAWVALLKGKREKGS